MADFSRVDYVLAKFDTNKDGRIEYSEFVNMNMRFPALLFPAFEMQDKLAVSTSLCVCTCVWCRVCARTSSSG